MEYIKPVDLAIPVFALTIAIEYFFDLRSRAGKYSRRDMWTNIALGFVSAIFGAMFGVILAFFYTLLFNIAPYKMPMDAVWPWVILVLADDFAYYWFHRLSHESRILWNLHVVHHSSEHFNLSVAVRQSWFGNLANWIFYIPLGLLGFPLWAYVLTHSINLIYQYWIHTPFIKSMGPLEYVMNTPSHHRVHHAVNEIYLDKNYAGIFIIWDRMFGTFVQETEEPRYGIIKPIESFNWLWINTHAWFEMFAAMKERKTLLGKLRCVFAAPNMDFVEVRQPLNYEK
jgi:alkylglycerol monooxygenase